MTRSKLINAHPVFVEKIRNVENGMKNKFGDKWTDSKVTKHIAENLDWDRLFNPIQESKYEQPKKKPLFNLSGLKIR